MNLVSGGPAAALVGVLPGVQSSGVWTGRRQIMVRFAGEAETAVMYSAAALADEVRRLASRARFHSIVLTGNDPLGNVECLKVALESAAPSLPVTVQCDGQRPEAVRELAPLLSMVEVCSDGTAGATDLGGIYSTLGAARESGLQHALALEPVEHTTDAQLLRLVEQSHAVSDLVSVVIHPEEPVGGGPLESRWSDLLGQAAELHDDVRLVRRLRPARELRR